MKSKAYFSDGHVEKITGFIKYYDDHIIFDTESGRYRYRAWFDECELLCMKSRRCVMKRKTHEFCKLTLSYEKHFVYGYIEEVCVKEWIPADIDRIEIYEGEEK